jgi:hypothetical protein
MLRRVSFAGDMNTVADTNGLLSADMSPGMADTALALGLRLAARWWMRTFLPALVTDMCG